MLSENLDRVNTSGGEWKNSVEDRRQWQVYLNRAVKRVCFCGKNKQTN